MLLGFVLTQASQGKNWCEVALQANCNAVFTTNVCSSIFMNCNAKTAAKIYLMQKRSLNKVLKWSLVLKLMITMIPWIINNNYDSLKQFVVFIVYKPFFNASTSFLDGTHFFKCNFKWLAGREPTFTPSMLPVIAKKQLGLTRTHEYRVSHHCLQSCCISISFGK